MSVKTRSSDLANMLSDRLVKGLDSKYVGVVSLDPVHDCELTVECTKDVLDVSVRMLTGLVGKTESIAVGFKAKVNDNKVILNSSETPNSVGKGVNHYYVSYPEWSDSLHDYLEGKYKYYLVRLALPSFRKQEKYTSIKELVNVLFEIENSMFYRIQGDVRNLCQNGEL